tara:strand:- start:6778 stop:8160 length:1383 start_codon:yes stop_codon:yes gene_type:complete
MADNAYSNPQRIINNEFEIFSKANQKMNMQRERTFEIMRRTMAANKRNQQIIYERGLREKNNFNNRISEFSTGDDEFNVNIRNFWNDQVDEYFKIKNGISAGEIDATKGRQALDLINKQVNTYKMVAPEILMLAKDLKDKQTIKPGKPGAISSTTNSEMQEVLLSIANGKNTNIVAKDGKLFLFNPANGDEKGAMINIDELLKMQASGNVIKTVPDDTELNSKIVDNYLHPDNLKSAYVTYEYEDNPDDIENQDVFRYITAEKRTSLENSMYKGNAFSKVVEDNESMSILWADVYNDAEGIDLVYKDSEWGDIPDSLDLEQGEIWLKKQKEEARKLMIKKSVDDRIKALNLSERKYLKTQQKPKNQRTPYTNQTLESRGDEIDNIIKASSVIKSDQEFLTQLNKLEGKEIYTIKNGKIVDKSGDALIYDFKDPKSLSFLLGEAAGIEKRVMAVALLPKSK